MKSFVSIIILVLGLTIPAHAQQTILSLDSCIRLAELNYPIKKQASVIMQQSELEIKNILGQRLPELEVQAQASFQSDVTHLPIENPAFQVPIPNKDQYRMSLNINQLIYDGGLIKNTSQLIMVDEQIKLKQIEAAIYPVKEKVIELYFALLKIDARVQSLAKLEEYLFARQEEMESAVKNGVMLSSNLDLIKIELLKIKRNRADLISEYNGNSKALSQLINIPVNANIRLELPESLENNRENPANISRVEMQVWELQNTNINNLENQIASRRSPKLLGFMQGGYGNPGLNMLDNSFQPFYMAGIRLHWNIYDWNNSRRQQQIAALNKEMINSFQETFILNSQIQLSRYREKIDQQKVKIEHSDAINTLRNELLLEYESQYQNGTITYADYLNELTNAYQSEIELKNDRIQLQELFKKYDYIKGM